MNRGYPCTGLDKPLGLQKVEAVHEDGKVVTLKHRPPLPTRIHFS